VASAALGSTDDSAQIVVKLEDMCDEFKRDVARWRVCDQELMKWARVDAENGSSLGGSIYANELDRSQDCFSKGRVAYWLNRNLKVGGSLGAYDETYSDAKQFLKLHCS